MARKNRNIRWDRNGTSGTQHGKGKKRRRDWHRTADTPDVVGFDPSALPDVGSGADPTSAAPIPLRGKSPRQRRAAVGGAS